MTKIAVVTAMFLIEFPELDTLSSNFEKCDNYDYYVFTNDRTIVEKITNDWNIIEIDCSNQTKGVYLTKRVKWLTHEYLPDYDVIIWVDSFIVPDNLEINHINSIIHHCLDENTNIPIYMRTQKFKCINDDIKWCLNNHRIDRNMSTKIIDYIENTEQFSVLKKVQTYWSSAIIKNNKNQNLINMSIELYNYITNVCYRDQHILPVLFKKYNIKCNIIPKEKLIFINKGKQNQKKHKYVENGDSSNNAK